MQKFYFKYSSLRRTLYLLNLLYLFMKYFYTFIVLLIAFNIASAQAASYKKWIDEEGRVYYGDTPPRSVDTIIIKTNKRPTNIGKPLPRFPASSDEPAPAKDTTDSSPKSLKPEQAKVACEVARNDLSVLENNSPIQLRSADGTERYMTEDEIQQRLDRSNENIENFCK